MKQGQQVFNPDMLQEQIVNISKAHAYDILVEQVGELKAVIRELIEVGRLDIHHMDFEYIADQEEFKKLVDKAKILSMEV